MALMTMEDLFKKAGFSDFKKMEINKFYDISNKKLKILSYNTLDKKIEKKEILSLVYKGIGTIYKVVLKDGTILLKGTEGHYVFDTKKQEFVSLGETKELSVLNNNLQSQEAFVIKTNEKSPILDIEVKDNANYFSNGILSHNTGGTAIKFYATTRNRITKLDTLKNAKGEDAGIQIRVRNYKNKGGGVPWRDAIMNLYFDRGFDSDSEYFDFLVNFGLIHKSGGWFDAPDINMPKMQGADKVKAWLAQNPDIYDKLKVQVDTKLLVNNELDANNTNPDVEDATAIEKATGKKVAIPIEDEKEPPEIDLT